MSGSSNGTLDRWDALIWSPKDSLRDHQDQVIYLTFSEERMLASGSLDRTVRIWRPMTGECCWILDAFPLRMNAYQESLEFLSNHTLRLRDRDGSGRQWVINDLISSTPSITVLDLPVGSPLPETWSMGPYVISDESCLLTIKRADGGLVEAFSLSPHFIMRGRNEGQDLVVGDEDGNVRFLRISHQDGRRELWGRCPTAPSGTTDEPNEDHTRYTRVKHKQICLM
jgi:WD40 repeat protein